MSGSPFGAASGFKPMAWNSSTPNLGNQSSYDFASNVGFPTPFKSGAGQIGSLISDQFKNPTNYDSWSAPSRSNSIGDMFKGLGVGPATGLQAMNMEETLAGLAGIGAFNDSNTRRMAYSWGNLNDEKTRKLNAEAWLKDGHLLADAESNIQSRKGFDSNLWDRGMESQNYRDMYRMTPYSVSLSNVLKQGPIG